VGSSSDVSEAGEEKRKGVGGTKSKGERGGLLLNSEEADEEQTPTQAEFAAGLSAEERNPFADGVSSVNEDDFGDYEGVDEDAKELSRKIGPI